MTPRRARELECGPGDQALTPAEMAEGWHFCPEWDYMLLQLGHADGEQCDCEPWTSSEAADKEASLRADRMNPNAQEG
jgi:hypothetical protein